MEKAELIVKNATKLTNFLQRFSLINQSLLLKIENGNIFGITNTQEKNVVKFSTLQLDEIFDEMKGVEDMKVGVINIKKICDAIKLFKDEEFTLSILYDAISGTNVATGFNLKNNKIEIIMPCAPMKLFMQFQQDVIDKIASTDDPRATFELTKDTQAELAPLIALDDNKKGLISFKTSGGSLKAECKSFKMNLASCDQDVNTAILKEHYAYLDKEDLIAYVQDGKIVFVSQESDTKVIIGESDE
jgi:hypothetical protein